jgi:CDP-glucose 4,6-dehydratase
MNFGNPKRQNGSYGMTNLHFWRNKRVLITGHTGFKGAWLSRILFLAGAEIHGYSKHGFENNPLNANLNSLTFKSQCTSDICNATVLKDYIKEVDPDVVFHLAAQSLVLESYEQPLETFRVNSLGTANLCEAILKCERTRVLLNITTDKVYENLETSALFTETDKLGGDDPYSASKAASEIISASYRKSFFDKVGKKLGCARAGNVIGGGDIAKDRIIPDIWRASQSGTRLNVRNPLAIRPWQHVLEALEGYLTFAQKLYFAENKSNEYNFSPDEKNYVSVEKILELSKKYVSFEYQKRSDRLSVGDEKKYLFLSNERAKMELGHETNFGIEKALKYTFELYKLICEPEAASSLADQQIKRYFRM